MGHSDYVVSGTSGVCAARGYGFECYLNHFCHKMGSLRLLTCDHMVAARMQKFFLTFFAKFNSFLSF